MNDVLMPGNVTVHVEVDPLKVVVAFGGCEHEQPMSPEEAAELAGTLMATVCVNVSTTADAERLTEVFKRKWSEEMRAIVAKSAPDPLMVC